LKHQNDILWHNQRFAGVKASVIYLQQVETIGVSLIPLPSFWRGMIKIGIMLLLPI
jgi:hypothetical protein